MGIVFPGIVSLGIVFAHAFPSLYLGIVISVYGALRIVSPGIVSPGIVSPGIVLLETPNLLLRPVECPSGHLGIGIVLGIVSAPAISCGVVSLGIVSSPVRFCGIVLGIV